MSGRVKVGPAKKRPPANTLLPVMFAPGAWEDGRHRLRPEAERQLVAELRCPRKRHLIAVVVRTEYGPWAAWWESHFTNELDLAAGPRMRPVGGAHGVEQVRRTELAGCSLPHSPPGRFHGLPEAGSCRCTGSPTSAALLARPHAVASPAPDLASACFTRSDPEYTAAGMPQGVPALPSKDRAAIAAQRRGARPLATRRIGPSSPRPVVTCAPPSSRTMSARSSPPTHP